MRAWKLISVVAGLTILSTGCTGDDSGVTKGNTSADPACTPTCDAGPECLSLADNTASTTPGFRMSQLALSKPTALASGIMNSTIESAVLPALSACNVQGGGTFSWLLQFDTAAGTVKTGGAKPVADPTQGYTFVDETVDGLHVAPVVASVAPGGDGTFSMSTPFDNFVLPIYLDGSGGSAFYLPLRGTTFVNGTLSDDNNCIGEYNAENLDPANGCMTDGSVPTFLTAATVTGIINLEDADTIQVDFVQQSLCVLLSGDAATYGDHAASGQKCKRTDGTIDFKGDACSQAGQSCSDSVSFEGTFAASAVTIH